MTECEYCGGQAEDPHECGECGETFCYVHAAPEHHRCPDLDEEVSGEVTCDRCGSVTDDPRTCPDCGGTYCEHHTGQITHDCPDYERPAASSSAGSLSEVEVDEGGGLFAGGFGFGRVPVVVAALLVMGLATGVVGPGLVSGMFDNGNGDVGGAGAANSTPTAAPFDEERFRQEVYGWIEDRRTGTDLRINDSRQAVAEAVAADMARYGYPDDSPTARASWNLSRRLRMADATCRVNATRAAGVDRPAPLVRTSYDTRLRTGDGVERYTTMGELADATTELLGSRNDFGDVFDSEHIRTQALGVHYDEESGFVYVVYIPC